MGGGAAMRTAASRIIGAGSVIGLGSAIRGSPTVPRPDNKAFTSARRPAASALLKAQEGGFEVVDQKSAAVSWLVDEWDFAGVEEEDVVDQMPRVVFGGAPSLQEAKEATMELKDAVEKIVTLSGHQGAELPLLMGEVENSELTSVAVVPKRAVQAFRFLSENPAAQNVVASIASDPDVWNAVLKNTAFVDYLESHKIGGSSPDVDVRYVGVMELQDLNCSAESETSFTGSSQSGSPGASFAEILENIKLTVMDIVDSISSFFQDVFTPSDAADDANRVKLSFIESTTLKASIMGLAIMVISMVVLKRA